MLNPRICDLLGIAHPIVQAAIWPATAPELVAAVSNAGALGSIGAVFESADSLGRQIAQVRELTDRPFAVNHVVPLLNEEAFALTVQARPAVISFALGDPGDLVARAQEIGATVLHQVHTVRQAEQAAERGVDGIIAQGGEAGGQGLAHGPSTMVLVPQVVDAVNPIPVLAAGGIADGRGLAAAIMLGAQGVNIGTRFLASKESSAPEEWKRALLTAKSEDAVRFETWAEIMPTTSQSAYETVPRVLRSAFVEAWRQRPNEARQHAEQLRGEIMEALRSGSVHELLAFTGQTTGQVRDILPAADIVHQMIAQAERALSGAIEMTPERHESRALAAQQA